MTSFEIPALETDRLILRAPHEKDFEAEAEFYASDVSQFVGGPMKAHQAWRNLAMLLGHWMLRGYGFWAVDEKETGVYQGRVGLWYPHGWAGREIGWTLMQYATGKGYATEAAIAARAYAFETLGWATAISQISERNDASKAVARRLGASHESTYEDQTYGSVEIWRHPAPDARTTTQHIAHAERNAR